MTTAPLVLVSGPTASGKSDIALRIAKELTGEILNIDSVQVYEDLDIGSAKPSREEQQAVPHHLLNIVAPDKNFSVAQYIEHATKALSEVYERKRIPVFVGGTGMYIRSLLHGLADLPPGDESLRLELEKLSNEELHEKLRIIDSNSAEKLHVNDRVRIIRALETSLVSGTAASVLRAGHGYEQERSAIIIIPCWKRSELYRRIDERSNRMIENGLIEEVERIAARYGSDAPALNAIGYRETVLFLRGKMTQNDLVGLISQSTRQFAKRQMTFWRNEPRKRRWEIFPREGEGTSLLDDFISSSRKNKILPPNALSLTWEDIRKMLENALRTPVSKSVVWFVKADDLL